jgi:hypothetical protein
MVTAMKIRHCIGLIAIFGLFVSCTFSPPSELAVLTATSTSVISTSTLLIPAKTPTLHPTQISTSTTDLSMGTHINDRCLNIETRTPENVKLSGWIVFNSPKPSIYNLADNTIKTLSSNKGDFSVSPNGQWLAYDEIAADSPTGKWLAVEDIAGLQKKKMALQPDWFWGVGVRWFDNNRLLYNVIVNNSITTIYPIAIIDPFNNKYQEIPSDYPNLRASVLGLAGTMQFVSGSVVYDPSLDLVVYPETTDKGFYVVLWDRTTKTPIAKLKDFINFQHLPQWLPDGSEFVVAVATERQGENWIDNWFAIKRNGAIRQLSHFENTFDFANIYNSNLSPNGRYLAFSLEIKPSEIQGPNLAIIDLETLQITDYCIPKPGSAIWSPDSKYMVVTSLSGESDKMALVIDPIAGWATRLSDNDSYDPRGWMQGTP